jgi:23S rRNA pseudouridine1911/1915/1917 synthase
MAAKKKARVVAKAKSVKTRPVKKKNVVPRPVKTVRPTKAKPPIPAVVAPPVEVITKQVPESLEPGRVDKVLTQLLEGVSRSRVQKALDLNLVKVNGVVADRRTNVQVGDLISLSLPEQGEPTARPVKMSLEVIFEDAHIIAINKPAGLLTHPVQGSDELSVVHGLLHYTKGKLAPAGGAPRPGVVHRLDRETSGVIVLAKTDKAYHALVSQFAERAAQKEYLALVDKTPRLLSGVCEAKIDRHRTVRVRMAVREDGRDARTEWRVEEKYGAQAALVRAYPHTGRTHQIRVHLAHLGHPILGDRTYGKFDTPFYTDWPMPRVMLHAHRLTLTHPHTGKPLVISVEPPADFKALQTWLALKYTKKVYASAP